jgi:hypothetical protein
MYLYIELWKAKESWKRLPVERRKELLMGLLEHAKRHPITGVLPCSVKQVGDAILFDGVTEQPVVVDTDVARPTGFAYAAAWMIPTRELIRKFEERVESLGWWFDYFEQENAWGLMDVNATIDDMVNAGESRPATRPPADERASSEPPQGLVARVRQTGADVREIKDSLREILASVRR